jgi:SAM-dependent methyltransferase
MHYKTDPKSCDQMQHRNTELWDALYQGYEKGFSVGIQYPTESLVRFVSNLRKRGVDKQEYYNDYGKEYSVRNNFSGRALEIGFGSVANLRMMHDRGFMCRGLEVSRETVDRGRLFLREQGIEDIELNHWKPYQLPYDADFFDLVYGLQCLYYNLHLEKVIDEIYRTMKPGGSFLFSFFSDRNGYMEYVESTGDNIYQFNNKHPNKRLRGAYFRHPKSKEELASFFQRFTDVNVFMTETDQAPVFDSWWYVTGIKA